MASSQRGIYVAEDVDIPETPSKANNFKAGTKHGGEHCMQESYLKAFDYLNS